MKPLSGGEKTNPIQTQSNPVLSAVEWANFRKAQMNVNSFITKDYRKSDAFAVQKNKPNSNPISSKAKMNANAFSQKDYENETAFKLRKNKPNSNPILKRMNVKFCATGYYIYKIALSVNSYTRPLVRKINHFLVKSLPKIAEKRLKMACRVHNKAKKPLKTEVKPNLVRRLKMSWNLFEKIINAFKPNKQSEQPSEVPDPSQSWPEGSSDSSQSWPESSSQQPEASQEPSQSYQETPSAPQQNEWQQE